MKDWLPRNSSFRLIMQELASEKGSTAWEECDCNVSSMHARLVRVVHLGMVGLCNDAFSWVCLHNH